MYVLMRTDQGGGFLAKRGYKHAYVSLSNIQQIRKFHTREEAEGNQCVDNEIIADLDMLMR